MVKFININYPKLTIYGLVSEDEPNNIKYVGITGRNPLYRLSNHMYEAKNTPDKNNRTKWISSKDCKLKQSLAKIGKKGNANGFKHSEDTKNKKRKKILQYSDNGDFIKEWSSVTEIAKYFNVTLSIISKVLKKENNKYKNFILKIKTENNG